MQIPPGGAGEVPQRGHSCPPQSRVTGQARTPQEEVAAPLQSHPAPIPPGSGVLPWGLGTAPCWCPCCWLSAGPSSSTSSSGVGGRAWPPPALEPPAFSWAPTPCPWAARRGKRGCTHLSVLLHPPPPLLEGAGTSQVRGGGLRAALGGTGHSQRREGRHQLQDPPLVRGRSGDGRPGHRVAAAGT